MRNGKRAYILRQTIFNNSANTPDYQFKISFIKIYIYFKNVKFSRSLLPIKTQIENDFEPLKTFVQVHTRDS